jgi:hypothetical protein
MPRHEFSLSQARCAWCESKFCGSCRQKVFSINSRLSHGICRYHFDQVAAEIETPLRMMQVTPSAV